MKTLTLVVDERELSTIHAALLLLQEQSDGLPEDLAEMMREHGLPMTEAEISQLSRRLSRQRDQHRFYFDGNNSGVETRVEVERFPETIFASK